MNPDVGLVLDSKLRKLDEGWPARLLVSIERLEVLAVPLGDPIAEGNERSEGQRARRIERGREKRGGTN